jgi:signal transduction histidine kinase
VLRGGFILLSALLIFATVIAFEVQANLSNDTAEIYRRHIVQDDLVYRLRRTLWLGSTAVRDFLLNPLPNREQILAQHLTPLHRDSTQLLEELGATTPHSQAVRSLKDAVEGFWVLLERVPQTTKEFSPLARYEFVQREVVPQRNATGDVVREFGVMSARALEESEQAFRATRHYAARRLMLFLGLSLVCGVLVSVFSVLHAERMERAATRHFSEVVSAKQELEQLSARLMQVQEEERANLARELHDEIGQIVATLRLEINRMESGCQRPDEVRERAARARALTEKTVQMIRNLTLMLRPSVLDDLGLGPALQWQADDFMQRTGVAVDFTEEGLRDDLPEAVRTCVYRVLQESLHNCEKHAGANAVRILISEVNSQLTLTIDDNGVGFHPDQQRGGLGLIGMRERAQALDGSLSVQSTPGEGTRVVLQLPVPEYTSVAVA